MTLFRSFRWQLILISMLSGGISIAAFGWFSWTQIYNSKLRELDLELQNFASRNAGKIFSVTTPEGHQNKESVFSLLDSTMDEEGFAAQMIDSKGETIWKNKTWPDEGLDVSELSIHAKKILIPENHQRRRPPPSHRSGVPSTDSNDSDRPPFPGIENDPRFPRQGPSGPLGGGRPGFGGPNEPPALLEQLIDHESAFFKSINTDLEWRLYVLPTHDGVIIIASSKQALKADMKALNRSFLFALPLALAFIAGGAAFIGTRAIRPVKALTRAAESIQATNFDQRIDYSGGGEEFRRLIKVYNQMLERLDDSFAQAKRFSADAAHELNTPLTILQGNLDNALQEAEVGSSEQQQYSSLLEEVKQLGTIIRKLLVLSRVDSGNVQLDYKIFSLNEMISQLLEDSEIMWEELTFETDLEPDISIQADRDWIQQIVSNLLTNACKYNKQENGWVRITLAKQDDEMQLMVLNSGDPIPAEAENKLFDRFFRVQSARSTTNRSLGLGLSLANEFARLHNGTLALFQNNSEGIGFRLTLPININSE